MNNKEAEILFSKITTKRQVERKSNYFLYLIAGIVNLLSFGLGSTAVWITPIIVKLDGSRGLSQSPFERVLTPTEISWLVGGIPGGGILGTLIAGKIVMKFGRKKPMICYGITLTISCLILAFSKHIYYFYFARYIAGFAIGCMFSVLPLYLTEIAEAHNRGALGCSTAIFQMLGVNFSLSVGPYLSISTFSLSLCCPLAIFIISFALLAPESPIYLATKNYSRKLASSLQKIRCKNPDQIQKEITDLINVAHKNQKRETIRALYKNKINRKTFTISLGLATFKFGVGYGYLLFYLQVIFEAAKTSVPSNICIAITAFCQLLGIILSSLIVDRVGRRRLLLVSTSVIFLSLLSLAVYLYLQTHEFNVKWLSWLPLLSLALFINFFGLGLGPVTWVMAAEILPNKIKPITMSLMSLSCLAVDFITVIIFPIISLTLGYSVSFFIFACIAFCAFTFIYFMVPETKGQTLEEIQQMLK